MKSIIFTYPMVTGLLMIAGLIVSSVFTGIVIGFFLGKKTKPETREHEVTKSKLEVAEGRIESLEGMIFSIKNHVDMSTNRMKKGAIK